MKTFLILIIIPVVSFCILSLAAAQNPYYGWANPYYYPMGFPHPNTTPQQYLTQAQQQHLTNLAHQHTKMLAMSQMRRPQMMYTSIAGATWPKWPTYKPQYAYTKHIQPFLRPQVVFGQHHPQPQLYPNFVKMPMNYAIVSPTTVLKNFTKTPAISTINHVVKPINYFSLPFIQNLVPTDWQSKFLFPLQTKHPVSTQHYNSVPTTTLTKNPVVVPHAYPQKNPTFQHTKYVKNIPSYPHSNSVLNYQLAKPSSQQPVQAPINTLMTQATHQMMNKPQKVTIAVPVMKNVMTVQTPSSLVLTASKFNKNQATAQVENPDLITNDIPISVPVLQSNPKPQTYSAFMGQTLLKNEPYYGNHISQATGTKTILTPVKSDGEKGPIYTIPAPNLSLEDKNAMTNQKTMTQQKPTFKVKPQEIPVLMKEPKMYRHVVQEVPQEIPVLMKEPKMYRPMVQEVPVYAPVVQKMPVYKPMVQESTVYRPVIQETNDYKHFGEEVSTYKPIIVQGSTVYNSAYEMPKYNFQSQNVMHPAYEVTETPTENETLISQSSSQYKPNPNIVYKSFQTESNFSPMIVSPKLYQNKQTSQMLTSQEFYDILNSVTPQHQLSTVYSTQVEEESQDPNMMQHTISVGQPLQMGETLQKTYNSVQPVYHYKENVENPMFQQQNNYVKMTQGNYVDQGSAHQPTYQQFTSEDSNKYESSPKQQQDSTNQHFSIVRNTKDEKYAKNQNEIRSSKEVKPKKKASTFIPTPLPEVNRDVQTMSKPVGASYQLGNDAPEHSVSKYFPPLTEKEVDETLATIQVASNLMKAAKNQGASKMSKSASSFQPYFEKNIQYQFAVESNNALSPVMTTVEPEKDVTPENHVPIRIFVPDLYEDEHDDTELTNKSQENKDAENVVVNYDTIDTEAHRSPDYGDYSAHITVPESRPSNVTKEKESEESIEESKEEKVKESPPDVLVLLQKNKTDPTLDIVTKDWKTSIVIKSKESEYVKSLDDEEFGSRIRQKRQEDS